MIYLDTSVALAHLLAEDRQPPRELWGESLVASRLLEYELWTRLHARKLGATHGEHTAELIARVAIIELVPAVLMRALDPFPGPVRTLDALHLASMDFLQRQGQRLRLASYDQQLCNVARKMGMKMYEMA